MQQSRGRHEKVDQRTLKKEKQVKMEYIHTKEQTADIFTKPLPKDTYEYLRGKLGVKSLTQET